MDYDVMVEWGGGDDDRIDGIAKNAPEKYGKMLRFADRNGDINKNDAAKYYSKVNTKYLMSEEEYKIYQSLPAELTIYRGTRIEEVENCDYGISWTTDLTVADKYKINCIIKATVNKDGIAAYFADRNESEVIIPHPVGSLSIEKVRR